MCYENYQGQSVRKLWNRQTNHFSSAQWPGEHKFSCSLQTSFFSLEMWKINLVSGSAMGAYINYHIGADFILANLVFSHCLSTMLGTSPVLLSGFSMCSRGNGMAELQGLLLALPTALCGGLGSSPTLTASQLSPLENCKGDSRTFKMMWKSHPPSSGVIF